ncbi:MAG TPA: transketolase [Firmicutes bacterium]|nr:transketolase [Bacillota bacterium]
MEQPAEFSVEQLGEVARRVRRHIVTMIHNSRAGHPGGSLSSVEILVSLFFKVMRVSPEEPGWPERDRFVLSKGHASAALYAVLAERGFFPTSELLTFDAIDSRLQGHVDMTKTPGVDMSTGSLGQGLSAACGMAVGAKIGGRQFRVYCLLGDGETQEGQVWEAAMFAGNRGLDNLTAIVDYNKLQLVAPIAQIMPLEPYTDKWRSFGWSVIEVDGHDFEQLLGAFHRARDTRGVPTVIIAHTVKGKGVSFMEGQVKWHSRPTTDEEFRQAIREINVLSEDGTGCGTSPCGTITPIISGQGRGGGL